MTEDRRKFIQDLYIRICRDSLFKMDFVAAAQIAGKVGDFHPMEVLMALPSMDVMMEIARGEHPCVKDK
jgi:hypothetical protein